MTQCPPAKIGDALEAVDTPALIVDLDAFERNVGAMMSAVSASPVRLRPHAKSHKCPAIAARQIAAGAVGICCQKVSEAEAFVDAGIGDILLTNEVVGEAKCTRLAELAKRAKIGVLVDDAQGIADLARAARAADTILDVLIELDVGAHRCGVLSEPAALALAKQVAGERALRLAGVQAYHGSAQHLRTPEARRQAAAHAASLATTTKTLLQDAGLACATISGAGTGTFVHERSSGVFTELQAGSYIFMDADYGRNELGEDDVRFAQSLHVWTMVMSRPTTDRAIVDAGLKASSVDSGLPLVMDRPGVEYVKATDEHGELRVQTGATPPSLGEKIRLIPGHCDPTVNLYDWLVGVRGETVETVWPVAARGCVT